MVPTLKHEVLKHLILNTIEFKEFCDMYFLYVMKR